MEYLDVQNIQNSPCNNETKLCIIIDSKTPIIMKVPQAQGRLTLKKFKDLTSLKDDHYKFYFKSQDSEFGVVKEEVVEDDSELPIYGDRIVAWIISDNTNQLSLFEPEIYQDRSDVDSITKETFNSMRRRLCYEMPINQATHHDTRPQEVIQINVQLNLDNYNFLGLTLVGPSDENGSTDRGIHVGGIARNSVVEQDGRIEVGDRITEINGLDVRNMKNDDAVTIFRSCVERRGAINLVLERSLRLGTYNKGRFTLPREYANVMNYHNSLKVIESKPPLGDFPPPPHIPIFNHVNTHTNLTNNHNHQRIDLTKVRSVQSLPRSITPRSLYATSNFDNIQTNLDSRFRIDSRSAYEATTPTSLRQLDVALHCGKDDIYTIYAALKNNAQSLDIKDREWLKVVVKNAFLGSSLVKWLTRNVYGFGNKREVKRFANQMLSIGLIRSPITSGAFSEKCYYTLTS